MRGRVFVLIALVVVLLQTAVIGWLIFDRAQQLTSGREVVVQTRFIDPRDLFRGHYVRLNLSVGELDPDSVSVDRPFDYGETVYAELAEDGSGYWRATRLWHDPAEGESSPRLKGEMTVVPNSDGGRYMIAFPFDRYFAPKLRAIELENYQSEDKLGVILSVQQNGEAAIKGITINGEQIYDEPVL